MEEFDTIVLRFRDLNIETGETIKKHNDIIADKGYVWWGWWKKSHEKLPIIEIKELREKLVRGKIIYLLDSGQGKLFNAMCTEIMISNGDDINSPNQEATPEYYRDKKVSCWFRFTNIIENNEYLKKFIKKFVYVRVNELFISRNSRYGLFYNKKICSLDEMIQQNRTMWFIKKAAGYESVKEIQLLSNIINEPTDFEEKYVQRGGDTLLLLSDLHFDVSDINNHMAFPYGKDESIERKDLQTLIKNVIINENLNLAGVIISGDFTWTGDKKEFQMAEGFVKNLPVFCESELDEHNIAIAPGNHDIQYKKGKSNIKYDSTYKLKFAGKKENKNYAEFYTRLYGISPNEYFSLGKRVMLDDGQNFDIVCLNSCCIEQIEEHFRGIGYIQTAQLEDAAKKMKWDKKTNAIRIVALHHHYMPVCACEEPEIDRCYSVFLNAEEFVRWVIKYNVDIVVHGHMHQSFVSKVTRYNDKGEEKTFTVIGLGSAGANKNHYEEENDNVISVIKMDDNKLHLIKYALKVNGQYEKLKDYKL